MPRKTWTKKDERMYKHILKSCKKKRGRSAKGVKTCQRIAAATVNQHRTKSGRLGSLATTARKRRSKRRAHGVTYKTREQADRRKRYAKGKKLALSGTRRGISIDRERLDRGGYTASSRYFGVGEPLYMWSHEASGEGGYVRAANAKEARAKVERMIARANWRRDPVGYAVGKYGPQLRGGLDSARKRRKKMTELESMVWRSTPRASKTVVDGERFILELDPEMGTVLVPIHDSRRVRTAMTRLTPGELWTRDAAQAEALWVGRSRLDED